MMYAPDKLQLLALNLERAAVGGQGAAAQEGDESEA